MKPRLVLILFFFLACATAAAQVAQLPVYHLSIDSEWLDYLNAHPKTDDYFPARFVFGTREYSCRVRFRGASARTLPKKSWRIRFEDNENCFHQEVINLNAEYRDRSLLRNHLGMTLYRFMNLPCPETQYVNLHVNGDYFGVFLQVEDVNEDFFSRIGHHVNALYKGKNHGARMAPLVRTEDYSWTWEKKIGDESDYADLQKLLSKIVYWSPDAFSQGIESEVDMGSILPYFAIQFAVSSIDCFTKNLFLGFNEDRALWELFPWDVDAAFGNDWRGDYNDSLERFYLVSPLTYHNLFQRLMGYDSWLDRFNDLVQHIIHQGFDAVCDEIDEMYPAIREDVYRDPQKVCSNAMFDSEMDWLKTFLANRRDYLNGRVLFEKVPLGDYYCSNPLPSARNREVIFRVRSPRPQRVFLCYARNFDFSRPGATVYERSMELFDDGNHSDGAAGDEIYGNRLADGYMGGSLTPFYFKAAGFAYPENGLDYLNYVPTRTLALNSRNDCENLRETVQIGTVYAYQNESFVQLINSGGQPLDLSYFVLNSGPAYQSFLLPEHTVLVPEETLMVASDLSLAGELFPGKKRIGPLFFSMEEGDTVKLLSPALSEIISQECEPTGCETPGTMEVVITEINYHSSPDMDSGDWFELYNPHSESCDLSGWSVSDGKDDHRFVIPEGTILCPDSFLVICQEGHRFHAIYPDVNNYVGSFDFGLSNGGECVRVFDQYRTLKDSVGYMDEHPWPEIADGQGASLQLIDPLKDNALPENWYAEMEVTTPGRRNRVDDGPDIGTDEKVVCYQNYPNPFNHSTAIVFTCPESCVDVKIKVYDVTGRLVETLYPESGSSDVLWMRGGLASGVYLYRLETAGRRSKIRKAIALK